MGWNAALRTVILAVIGNSFMRRLAERYGMKLGANRFVAAEALEETIAKVRKLNASGFLVTLDYLGESVKDPELAKEAAATIGHVIDAIRLERLNANVSVKLTQLGLSIDPVLCVELMRQLCRQAKASNNFVRIDMEDSKVTQLTIDVFKQLLAEFDTKTVGLVIQSYLYRSDTDVDDLGLLGANLRIVKGAYHESVQVVFPRKTDVDRNYLKLAKSHLSNGCYTAIATHDRAIIADLKEFADGMKISKLRYEFQMLYGVAEQLQQELVEEGYRVRIYTPFGKQWYPYFTRRIAERPANMWFVLRQLFVK
ncbi:proline dehydrogenase family protein [Paenibacillus chartarius]|uniref:proline dehydrogenase n=1 Tax=Paenibacillus chartarius TaxID=747481 RepID=A0ABV6DVK8_9BACL